jgi:hypothetical protein
MLVSGFFLSLLFKTLGFDTLGRWRAVPFAQDVPPQIKTVA